VLSISYNQPVRDRDGQLQGVIGADLILTQLNSRLRQIWGERPGLVLITERSGLLVASSDGQTVQAGPPGRPPRRLRLDQSPDPRLKKLGTLLLARADAGRLPARFQRLSRDDTFLEVIPWADRHGLDWLVLVLIPRNALAASLQPHSWLPLLLYLLALTLAILVSARLTRWILRPLRRVTEEAVQLADTVRRAPGETLSFRAALPPGSALEIQSLGNAISTLVTSLNGLVTAQRRSGPAALPAEPAAGRGQQRGPPELPGPSEPGDPHSPRLCAGHHPPGPGRAGVGFGAQSPAGDRRRHAPDAGAARAPR
jgi:hypothetical protein